MGKDKRTKRRRAEATIDRGMLATHLAETSRLSLFAERERGAAMARSANVLAVCACVLAGGVLVASALLSQRLSGWCCGVLGAVCAIDVALLLTTVVTSLGAQTAEGHVRLGSPKDFEAGLAALLRTRAKADTLDATEMLCASLDLVFQDLRATNDGRRAAVRTASAFLYAALGVTVAAVVLLCVLAFLMG